MIGKYPHVGIRVFGSGGGNLDPDVQALIDAIEGGGGTLTQTEIDYLQFMIPSLKGINTSYNPTAIDFWTDIYYWHPYVGGTATSCKWNAKDPQDSDAAYRLAFSGSNTFSANGWQGGANGYANTFLKPNINTNNIYFGFYDRTNVWTNGRYWGGAFDGSSVTWHSFFDTQFVYINTVGTGVLTGPVQTRGFIVMSRSAANDVRGYVNGVQEGATQAGADSTGTTNDFYLQATNGLLGVGYAQKECASSICGTNLTAAKQSILYDIMQQGQTILGRQV